MSPGDVAAFELVDQSLRVTRIDGREHESYRQPKADDNGVPIPPSWLTQAFTLKPNSLSYLDKGANTAKMVVELLAEAGVTLTASSCVLDFGCGAGRVARALRKETATDIVGYDLHTAAIDWCRAHMPYGRWEHGKQTPPLDEQSGSFDLIMAFSVLTHLDEHHQDLWLAEWRRLLKSNGIAIVTFRSEHFLEKIMKPERPAAAEYVTKLSDQLAAGGFAYVTDDGWAGVFPEYYQDAYHSIEYVKTRWGRDFNIVAIHPANTLSGSRQDVAVLRKP